MSDMQTYLIAHALIVDQQGRILILRRSAENDVLPLTWDIPGGSCESGEDPQLAATRETLEETSLHITDLQLFSYTSNIDAEKDTQFVRLIFLTKYPGGYVRLNPAEHETFTWIDPSAPDQSPLVEYLPNLLKEVLKRNV